MIENLKELFTQTETKSDFSILILGTVLGYLLSIKYGLIQTIEPEMIGVIVGSSILAIKKLIEVIFEKAFRKIKLNQKKGKILLLLKREGILDEELSTQIQKQHELFLLSLISESELDSYFDYIVKIHLAVNIEN